MTKTDKVRNFLRGNTFNSCAQALQLFQDQEKESITYPQFNALWRELLNKSEFTVVAEIKVSASIAASGVVPDDQKEAIKLYTPTEIEGMFDDSILIPFISNTILDSIISSYGGLLPATVNMIPGESGVGKTSVLLTFLGAIKKLADVQTSIINKKIEAENKKLKKGEEPAELQRLLKLLFVSSEMNAIHMYKYQRRIKLAGLDIKILFLGQYDFPHDVLERELNEGYDIVLIDSFQDTIDKVRDACGMAAKQAEGWLLKLMDRTRLKGNKLNAYTSFLCTQHMTKGGEYTGSTRIKHMTDSMMTLAFDENEHTYIEFNKNRDGSIRRRLYFKLSEAGVEYDVKRFEKDADIKATIDREQNRKEESSKAFDEIVAMGAKQAHVLGEEVEINAN